MSSPADDSRDPPKGACKKPTPGQVGPATADSNNKLENKTKSSDENRLFLRAVCKSGFTFRVTTFQPLRSIAHNYRKRYNHHDCLVDLYKDGELIKAGETFESLGFKTGDMIEVHVGGVKADVIRFEQISQSHVAPHNGGRCRQF